MYQRGAVTRAHGKKRPRKYRTDSVGGSFYHDLGRSIKNKTRVNDQLVRGRSVMERDVSFRGFDSCLR